MPQFATRRYSEQPRYLHKVLREAAYRIEELAVQLTDDETRQLIPEDQWCAVELAGFLRDSESEDFRAVSAIIEISGSKIEERRAQYGPEENNYRDSKHIDELLSDFATLREETLWTLHYAEHAWNHVGRHPFRGDILLTDWVLEMNERDLDVMWRLSRIVDRLRS
jgi:hypothetical protein